MKNFLFKISFFSVFFVFVWSCKTSSDPTPTGSNAKLINASLVSTYTKDSVLTKLSSALGSTGNQVSFLIVSGVKLYKISYKTTGLNGEALTASGALFIPTITSGKMVLTSYQHGTLSNETDAPSYFNNASETQLGAFLSSTGMLVAMPDYLGYGDSKSYFHPYENRKGLAQANVDFLYAVKEYLTVNVPNWNTNIVLAGYSEGGYATMATQKMIQDNYSSDFNIKASSCGAGAYNKTATVTYFLKNKTSGETVNNGSYLWVLLTYDKIYNINRALSDYFVEPYLTQITKSGKNAQINVSFDTILTTNFKNGILNGTDTAWLAALKDNDIYDWKPAVPTYLYHGDSDTYVPFLNSQTAYDAMTKNGAKVTLNVTKGGTHYTTVQDFLLGTFSLISNFNS